jgi:hypothetical protein
MIALTLTMLMASAVPAVIPGKIPPPNAGMINCEFKDPKGKMTSVVGDILPAAPMMARAVQFSSQTDKIFEGKYVAEWGPHNAYFAKTSGPIEAGVFISMITPTYISQHRTGEASAAVKVTTFGPGFTETDAFQIGFCKFTTPEPNGVSK